MFGTVFFSLVALCVVNGAAYLVMRLRLLRMDTARDRIAWLGRNSDDVLSTYESLFPGSRLPRFCRLGFWTVIGFAAICLAYLLLTSK